MSRVYRIYSEKKIGFDIEGRDLARDLKLTLGIKGIKSLRILHRYDIEGISEETYEKLKFTVFSEPPVDMTYDETFPCQDDELLFGIEFLPGQYDQRADSAVQCIALVSGDQTCTVKTAKIIVIKGDLTKEDAESIINYCINPVESRKASPEKPMTLTDEIVVPQKVEILNGFIDKDKEQLGLLAEKMGFAMSLQDLEFCRDYFRNEEKRDPTVTELKVLDTYWSDHCRHTTFLTSIEKVVIEEGFIEKLLNEVFSSYQGSREYVYGKEGAKNREICLMDIATIAMKEMKKKGMIEDLDLSDEINACSIKVKVKINDNANVNDNVNVNMNKEGKTEDWLLMFKNETHNHPTEIEPFGGAATCIGGAIRDPLSGRSYVYQAMRVTGSGDPSTPLSQTLPGKLPQKKITTTAAAGYSSYGNQIGLSTGMVDEVYHPGYVAKRMEIGAVIGAAPLSNVVREKPVPGDVIVLLGGRTGRDGCGGATGSSREHDEDSLFTCGAEVQKGNPPTERKIQRFFRNPDISRIIKKCNDFGAGGVSVAIGELADGLIINLDNVPKKYEGLDGTELAISESQERMAVVVSPGDVENFIKGADLENLEATVVAEVTHEPRLVMNWKGNKIVDISRVFLNTNGVRQKSEVIIESPDKKEFYIDKLPAFRSDTLDLKACWMENLSRLETCSRKGLVERFDSTIGAATVLMPFGGINQYTPAEGMVAKLPVPDRETETCSVMTYGFNPYLSEWSPFHGAVFSIVEAYARIAACGADSSGIRLTLQEYFEKPGKEPLKWGKPFSALLGAYHAQKKLDIPAIGGKDSMSGTFRDMNVPPTLVAFGVAVSKTGNIISPEIKKKGSKVVLLPLPYDDKCLPDFEVLRANCSRIYGLASSGKLLSACTVREGGIAAALSKMCLGNGIGIKINNSFTKTYIKNGNVFKPLYGSIIIEVPCEVFDTELKSVPGLSIGKDSPVEIGTTIAENCICFEAGSNSIFKSMYSCKDNCLFISLDDILSSYEMPLETVFASRAADEKECRMKELSETEIPLETVFASGASDGKECRMKELSETEIPLETVFDSGASDGKVAGNFYIQRRRLAAPKIFIPVFPGTNCEYDTQKVFEKAGASVHTLVFRNRNNKDIEESVEQMKKIISTSQIIALPGGFSAGDEPEGSGKFIAAVFRNPYVKEATMELIKNRDGLILGICNGFQALIKLGLLPSGEIGDISEDSPTLTFNMIGRHVSSIVTTKMVAENSRSPWLMYSKKDSLYKTPVSHGEGRFVANEFWHKKLMVNNQIITRYVDNNGLPTYDSRFNPNGSDNAIEGIVSPDGRIFGKMGHNERLGSGIAKNIPDINEMDIFQAGVDYFRK